MFTLSVSIWCYLRHSKNSSIPIVMDGKRKGGWKERRRNRCREEWGGYFTCDEVERGMHFVSSSILDNKIKPWYMCIMISMIAWCYVMLCDVAWCCVMLRDAAWCCVMRCGVCKTQGVPCIDFVWITYHTTIHMLCNSHAPAPCVYAAHPCVVSFYNWKSRPSKGL